MDIPFETQLKTVIHNHKSCLSIGLDPDIKKLPTFLLKEEDPFFSFNQAIVEATADLVCMYKLNSAFYEALGASGIESLRKTFHYIRSTFPHIPLLLDGKRGDIGNTNYGTIQFAFEYLKADGITLYPFMGKEALSPFLELKNKGLFFLCRTSNPGAGEFFDLHLEKKGMTLYEWIGKTIAKDWNQRGNCFLVLGATHIPSLVKVREFTDHMIALVPGFGTQGGLISHFQGLDFLFSKNPLIFHVSRSIIYASSKKDFAERSRSQALSLVQEIHQLGVEL